MHDKYLKLSNDNCLKSISLNDKLYYTLKDIKTLYGESVCADSFCAVLKNDFFGYTNILHEPNFGYLKKLIIYLSNIQKHKIHTVENIVENESDIQSSICNEEDKEVLYITLDEWWFQLKKLISDLKYIDSIN